MTNRSLSTPNSGLRVFSASLLSALMIMMPFVQMAAGAKRSEVPSQRSESREPEANDGQQNSRTNAAAENVFLNAPVPKAAPEPLVGPVIVATKDDGLATATTVAPGGTINYSVNIKNNGTTSPADDATGVTFTDVIDSHTTLVVDSAVAAVSDRYNAIGNVQLVILDGSSDLLGNDIDPDTGSNVGMTATAETKSSTACTGGCSNNVVISADGSFTYNPPVGFSGTDTFTYTAHSTVGGGTATETVTITVANEIWFINNNPGACPGAPCDGRLTHPFVSLAAFTAANLGGAGQPGDNDWIFIYESATDYAGPATLRNGQKLIGQDATASLSSLTTFPAASGTDQLPVMNSGNGTFVNITGANVNGINLLSGNTLRGFRVGNVGTGTKISGTSFGTLVVGNSGSPDVLLHGTGRALNLTTGTLSNTGGFVGVTTTSSAAQGISLSGVADSGVGAFSFGSTTVSGSTSEGILVAGSTADLNFGATSVTGGTDGISLQNNASGTRTFGTLGISGSSGIAFRHFDPDGATMTQTGGGDVTVTGAATLSSTGSAISVIAGAPAPTTTINFLGATSATTAGAGITAVNWVGGVNTSSMTFSSLSITRNNGTALDASGAGTINVSSGTGSITNTTPGGPAIIAANITLNANFASIFSSGGNNGVLLTAVGGTSDFGSGQLTGTSGGSTFQISGGTISTTYSGGISQATVGALVTISGGHVTGAVTFSGALTASLGPGLQFNNADSTGGGGGYHFTGTTTLNGGDAGIDILNGSSGTFNFGASTTVSNASAGPSFNVSTGNPTVNFNGTLSQSSNAQRVIQIDGTTGNTITFANVVTSTANSTGILIQNANGGNVTFTSGINHGTSVARLDDIGVTLTKGTGSGNGTFNLGNVNIFTNNANGIQATDIDGTINISGTEVDSNNGTAIQIDGPSGLTTLGITLTRVDSAGGTANGITLIDTNGTFTVNGDGANTAQGGNASGGTISGKSGATGSTTTGSGVYLSNVTGITLRRMTINGTNQNFGVFGSNVTGFILQYSSVNGTNGDAGPGEATDEGSIRFNNLQTSVTFPSAQIDNCNIANGYKFNLFVINSTAATTLDRLMVTNNAFGLIGAAAGNDNVDIIARPNPASGVLTVKSTVQDNTFAGTRSDFVEVFADGNSVVDTKVLENKFNEGQATIPGGGVSVSIRGDSAGTASTHTYEVSCNRLGSGVATANGYDTVAMFIAKGNGNGTFSGSITNNVIGPPETGAANAAGLNVRTAGNGTHTYLVQNNSITGYTNSGIYMNNQDGDATVNASLFGNTTVGAGFAFAGLFVDSGATATDNVVMNLVAGSATVAGNKNDFSAGDPANGSDVLLITNASSTFNLSRNGSASGTVTGVVQDNNLNPGTTTVSTSGTINLVNTLPATPAAATACTTVASLATERRADLASRSASDQPERDAAGNIIVMQSAQSESSSTLVAAANTRDMSTSNVSFLTPIASALTISASETGARIAPTALAHSAEVNSQRSDVSEQKSEIRTHHAASSKLETRNTTRDEETGLRAHYATLSKLATRSATAAPAPMSGETVTANIGTLPAGGSVTVSFQVTVNNPPNLTLLSPPRVENQGTVSGGNFSNVLTDDPNVGGAADKTATQIDLFDTTTSLVSDINPSNDGDTVTFTATINETPVQGSANPTGTVDFIDTSNGNAVICNDVAVSGGTAQCAVSNLSAGSTHNIRADYSGDGNFDPSQSNVVAQVVNACVQNPIVTNTNDSGAGSLRDGLATVCSAPNNNITFNIPGADPGHVAGVYTITLLTELTINKNVNITGPNSVTNTEPIVVSGNNATRVLSINTGKTVTIRGLTIKNGNASGGSHPGGSGGGIFNQGTLTVIDSTFTGNTAVSFGGGIYSDTGVLNVLNSTFTGNQTTGATSTGGGIMVNGDATLTNSTFSGNTSVNGGGGVMNNNGTTTITNCTVVANTVTSLGGGIRSDVATTNLANTIVANNGSIDLSGSFTSQDYNLLENPGSATIGGTTTNNITGQDPVLGPLTNNGGPTQTHLLLPASPAIDAGDNAKVTNPPFTGPPFTDQRLLARIVDGADAGATATVDIGAVEVNYVISATAGTPQSTGIGTAFATALAATVSESGVPISGASVTFTAPAAGASGTFAGSGTATETVSSNGSGVATASAFTANNTVGAYTVSATATGYNGPADFSLTNNAATTAMTTQVSTATSTVGTPVSDTATLSGGVNPTGTITFNVYGPNDATCAGAAVFTSAAIPVSGNGNYGSGDFTPTAPGTYRWIATYSGDANNSGIAGVCNDANETVTVSAASPTLTTTASAGVTVGGDVSDTATIAGGYNPTGSITFTLYGPNDATCAGAPVFTSAAIPVNGNGNYGSGNFTTTAPGTYRWIASYSGDANNAAVAGMCNDANESVIVSQAAPTMTTQASGGVALGGAVSDAATLAGGFNPTGTITFTLYGPNDATCGGAPVFTSAAIPVAGNGVYNSGNFTPASPGVYRWIATYSGDANNSAVAGMCNDANESVTVGLDVSVQNAQVAEPSSGSANLIFTVSLSAPAPAGGVSVDFVTVDGTAKDGVGEANQDYTPTNGNVVFAAGQQVRTIHVPALADSDNAEVDETMTVTLSNPSANLNIADGTGVGTITVANTAGTMLISEFRQFGPGPGNDPLDDFVEIYNNTNAPITVPAGGYGLFRIPSTCAVADQPQLIGTIPAGTVIPARGHFLFTGPIANYTLKDYGATDGGKHNALLTADLGANENFGLFATADVSQLSSLNRLDAVGFGINNQNACDLLREGSTLNPVTTNLTLLGQHSFARKVCDWVQGSGCTAVPAGSPKDTNQNLVDFRFSDTNATNAGAGQNLGAPGPERAPDPGFPGVPGSVGGSPIKRDAPPGNSGMNVYLLDTSVAAAGVPNRFRNPGGSGGAFGEMTLRYRVLNNTGAPVTRLRYRIIDISTLPQPPGVADLRARTGSDVSVTNVNDPVTCNGGTPCTVLVRGTTLESPPTQPNGGGYNSTLSSGTVTVGTPLANGDSIPISFVLGVQQTGTFRFYIIVEALP